MIQTTPLLPTVTLFFKEVEQKHNKNRLFGQSIKNFICTTYFAKMLNFISFFLGLRVSSCHTCVFHGSTFLKKVML